MTPEQEQPSLQSEQDVRTDRSKVRWRGPGGIYPLRAESKIGRRAFLGLVAAAVLVEGAVLAPEISNNAAGVPENLDRVWDAIPKQAERVLNRVRSRLIK